MIALPGAWLLPVLLLVAQASPPTSGPVDTIRQATWETHRDHYVPSPLCARSEATLWSCAADGRSSRTACGGNQTLQLNYTLRLMYDAGLWER